MSKGPIRLRSLYKTGDRVPVHIVILLLCVRRCGLGEGCGGGMEQGARHAGWGQERNQVDERTGEPRGIAFLSGGQGQQDGGGDRVEVGIVAGAGEVPLGGESAKPGEVVLVADVLASDDGGGLGEGEGEAT